VLRRDDPTLAAALREKFPDRSWNEVRRLCETAKVRVNDTVVLDPATRLSPGARVEVNLSAPKPRPVVPGFRVEYEDDHLIVIEKPAGTTSVPYERKETGTALDLIRGHWRHGPRRRGGATTTPLYTVHRLDKETSGLLCFGKTRVAERGLHEIFQQHRAARLYLAVAHGAVTPGRIESRLVPDRGDGLRGSTRDLRLGQHAVTHVEVLERLPLASTCRIRLETGRTHQIRIHLAEAGHPIVGDAVYTRDRALAGERLLPTARLMLHATTLGFDHPVTGKRIELSSPPPPEFVSVLTRLGGGAPW
jgi:23S rRNA pseudouridine1911/1915/1917 synthase